nr:MAG TPA: hypothetical protein [Caudoviricetes sp.]
MENKVSFLKLFLDDRGLTLTLTLQSVIIYE